VRRKPRDAGRHLPQCRLHPLEGDAARIGKFAKCQRRARQAGRDRQGASTSTGRCTASAATRSKGLTGGIEFLFKKNKVEWIKGHAAFTSANAIEVGGKAYTADNFIIATGSSVTPLPGVDDR
jgi:pyruvate/2-oxoglutarate dehydrogenase complex dihydrolipoamide dehydrogenase (E3) component